MESKTVLVFSTPTWATCKSAKEFLTAKGVPFTTRDIAEDESAMKELQEKVPGAMSTPVILVDREVIMGFDRTKLQKALGLQWSFAASADSTTSRSPIRQRTEIRSTARTERGRPSGSVGTRIASESCLPTKDDLSHIIQFLEERLRLNQSPGPRGLGPA